MGDNNINGLPKNFEANFKAAEAKLKAEGNDKPTTAQIIDQMLKNSKDADTDSLPNGYKLDKSADNVKSFGSVDDDSDADCDVDDEPGGYYANDIDSDADADIDVDIDDEPLGYYGTDIDNESVPSEPPPPPPSEEDPESYYAVDVKDVKVESKDVSSTRKVLVKDLSEIDTNKYEIVHKQSMGSNRYLVFIKPKQ